ncbi:hypothetical protein I5R65_05375 [Herbaspirillum sp. AP02]|uniref:hypothetical protein n=1 Tax=unclassified Herbaspirillum TaxID=2624150 RepID=UPI0015DA1DFA|nr:MULTISPECIES: hypothetical protein [unclassified Herbaspirillum]MBG7618887.1 hypothetical protein [Herbaspirillum sp. AP02]NZD67311.1 hypothetical protein [Herbaspirillum sp. AP21]
MPSQVKTARLGVAIVLLFLLACAGLGGLLRAGALPPLPYVDPLIGRAAGQHATLMLSVFLGSVIAIERAVAVRLRWAYLAPLCSVAHGVLLLGADDQLAFLWAPGFGVASSLCFVAVSGLLLARQPMAHTVLMSMASLAWLGGNMVFAWQRDANVALLWWFAFVVLTITAERLEMSRLLPRHPVSRPLLLSTVLCLLTALVAALADLRQGWLLFGMALLVLAGWLAAFDVARRTIRAGGLSRYMAVCLLSGYGWLAVSGFGWVGLGLAWEAHPAGGLALRDLALHALGLGFIWSMVMAHAPVILPAVARVKVLYGPWFYGPLLLMHASLLLRCAGGWWHADLRALGASLNAIAITSFALTMLVSIPGQMPFDVPQFNLGCAFLL